MNKGINGCLYNCSDGCSGECISKERIPVNYNGEVVGYTVDGGKTMVFNDSDTSKKWWMSYLIKQLAYQQGLLVK